MNLNVEVRDEIEAVLKARARAQGVTPDRLASQVLEDAFAGEIKDAPATKRPPLSARIRDIWKDLPEDARAEYPEGGAYQIDHHVYGLPKG